MIVTGTPAVASMDGKPVGAAHRRNLKPGTLVLVSPDLMYGLKKEDALPTFDLPDVASVGTTVATRMWPPFEVAMTPFSDPTRRAFLAATGATLLASGILRSQAQDPPLARALSAELVACLRSEMEQALRRGWAG